MHTQRGVEGLLPVGDEARLVSRPAVDHRARIPGVYAEQLLEKRAPELYHCGPDRQLHTGKTIASCPARHARRGHLGQAGYLLGELRLERREEPPFSPPPAPGPSSLGWPSASAEIGRASQISSFTSTICSTWERNCL